MPCLISFLGYFGTAAAAAFVSKVVNAEKSEAQLSADGTYSG